MKQMGSISLCCITLGDLRPLRLIMTEERKEIHWGASAGRSCSSKWAISGPSSGMPSTNISSTALRLAANAVATSCHTPPPCKGESRRMQVLNRWVRALLWQQRWIERGWAHQHPTMSMRAATHRVNLPATQSFIGFDPFKYSRTMMGHFNFMEPKALPQWGGRALGQRLLLVDVLDCSFICEPQLAAALPRNWRSQRQINNNLIAFSQPWSTRAISPPLWGYSVDPPIIRLDRASWQTIGCGAPRAVFGTQRCAAPMPYPHGHACLVAVPQSCSAWAP